MIILKDVCKNYKKNEVLSNINMSFDDKGSYAFVGPNGCGKSVILSIICGYIRPSSGEVLINGETYTKKRAYIENAGIIINSPGFISELTVEENLYEIAKILDRENTKANIDKLLLEFNLDKHRKKKYLNTSLGMKQKMRLIQAFMEDHDIYILDEPTNALDKNTILQVHKIINELKKDKLVIITSHSDIDIKEMADKIYELDEGVLLNEEV